MGTEVLADVVVVAHLGFVWFVALGFVAVPLGYGLGWRWVRNRWYRRAHLAAIAFVAFEGLVGMVCPLTAWEAALRGSTQPGTFMGRLVHAVLFYDAPVWVFTVSYAVLAGVALALYWVCPPAVSARGAAGCAAGADAAAAGGSSRSGGSDR